MWYFLSFPLITNGEQRHRWFNNLHKVTLFSEMSPECEQSVRVLHTLHLLYAAYKRQKKDSCRLRLGLAISSELFGHLSKHLLTKWYLNKNSNSDTCMWQKPIRYHFWAYHLQNTTRYFVPLNTGAKLPVYHVIFKWPCAQISQTFSSVHQ